MPEEAIELLRGGAVGEILDHDVGARERTGYDVLLWRSARAARARRP